MRGCADARMRGCADAPVWTSTIRLALEISAVFPVFCLAEAGGARHAAPPVFLDTDLG